MFRSIETSQDVVVDEYLAIDGKVRVVGDTVGELVHARCGLPVPARAAPRRRPGTRASGHYNLALVQLQLGNSQEAVLSLRRALHARVDFEAARRALAQLQSGWRAPLPEDYLPHDLLERFGEVSSVAVNE